MFFFLPYGYFLSFFPLLFSIIRSKTHQPEMKLGWTRLTHIKVTAGEDHDGVNPTNTTRGRGTPKRRWRDELDAHLRF